MILTHANGRLSGMEQGGSSRAGSGSGCRIALAWERHCGLWRSLVSALDWGSRGPGFKSRQPDWKQTPAARLVGGFKPGKFRRNGVRRRASTTVVSVNAFIVMTSVRNTSGTARGRSRTLWVARPDFAANRNREHST